MPMTKPTSEQVTFLASGTGASQRTVLDKLRDSVSVKDFGAVGDGVADDTAAIQATLNEAGNRIVTFPAGNYRINSTINLPTTSITIDLGKATILPYGSSRGFYSSIPTPAATTTWSSGFTRGTTVLGVGSASGMAVGQWLVIQPIQTGATPVRVAAHTSKITNISGTNITIADALVMDYTSLSGAAYVSIVAYSALNGDVQIHNGFVDIRNSTATPAYPDYGVGVIISGRENVLVQNVEFIGPNTSVYESRTPCLINGPCLNATVDQCRFVDGVHAGQFCGFGLCNKATLTNSTIDASGFGVVFTSCEYAEATSNYLTGKQREEARQALSLSIRGIKSFGCGQLAIQDNYISEYESATKIEYTESFIVSGNYCINCTYSATGASPSNAGITINSGTQNVNKQTSCTITNNAVINCGGSGIFTTDTIDSIVIDGNVLRNVARYGIYVQGGSSAIITNNSCWDCLQDTNSFYDTRAVITNAATRGLVDGNAVYSVTNTKPAAIGTNVHTVTGIGNWCTTQRLRDIVDPSVNGNIPHVINATISGVVPLTSNTNWLNPTALCGVGALPQQASLLTQSNAVAPTLVAATHSGGSIATSQSLYFDLGGAAFFVVSVNNRSVLCFGDQNYSGITLIASGTPNVFSNTIGTIDRINISKNASTNQIRIQNGTLAAQSISVCSFGGVPTSSSVV